MTHCRENIIGRRTLFGRVSKQGKLLKNNLLRCNRIRGSKILSSRWAYSHRLSKAYNLTNRPSSLDLRSSNHWDSNLVGRSLEVGLVMIG
jgi:hypothetical protein